MNEEYRTRLESHVPTKDFVRQRIEHSIAECCDIRTDLWDALQYAKQLGDNGATADRIAGLRLAIESAKIELRNIRDEL